MHRLPALLAVALLVGGVVSASAANLLVNPGFEDPITSDGPPFVGFWEGFAGSANSSAANSALNPRNGTQSLAVSILTSVNDFAGVFQDVTGLNPGDEYILSGWHVAPASVAAGVEVRIEWRDSVGDVEIARTPNLVPVPTDTYTEFSLTAAVPGGADTARVVYAMQTFGGGGAQDNTVHVDDVSFDLVPEPSVAVLVLLGATAAAARRRRIA